MSKKTNHLSTAQEQRDAVRERYGSIANASASCCANEPSSDPDVAASEAARLGYSPDESKSVVDGANLGLGCGNPVALGEIKAGETVLDLGSGGGFDCLLAAKKVGEDGFVIGVDMTPEMIRRARSNIDKTDVVNVEFRLGEIEHLPVADSIVDVILSNCVINLSPDKPQVFAEAFRVLRPGGRLAITDVVQTASMPKSIQTDPESVAACVGGAATSDSLESMMMDTGFVDVVIDPKDNSEEFIREWSADHPLEEYLVSARIEARKPASVGENP